MLMLSVKMESADSKRMKDYYHNKGGKQKKKEYYLKTKRDIILKNRYGIDETIYNELFASQKGLCAICRADYNGATRNLDVDHDHKTGLIRGLLCNSCNRGIGYLQDDPVIVEDAAEYLKKQ
jgi:hypothetical protein